MKRFRLSRRWYLFIYPDWKWGYFDLGYNVQPKTIGWDLGFVTITRIGER